MSRATPRRARLGRAVRGLRMHARRLGPGDERLGEPLADVALALGPRRAQLVDCQAGDDGRHEGIRRGDLLARLELALQPQEGLLDDVLGVADSSEHPVGDRERARAQTRSKATTREALAL